MYEFTKEELRWIIKQAKEKQKTAVGVALLTKVFEIERKAVKNLTIPVVVRQSEQLFCRNCKYDEAKSFHDKMWCRDCRQKDRFKAK